MAAFPQELEAGGSPLGELAADPLGALRRRRRWVILTLVLALTAAGAIVSQLPLRYEATAKVLVSAPQIREDLVRTTIQDDALQRINALIGEILSRERLVDLIEKHDPYPALREKVTLGEIATTLRNDISIVFEERVGPKSSRAESALIFSITVEADRATLAADLANDLATMFTEENIRMRSQQAELATSFLRKQLEQAEAELREQSRLVREFKEQHRGELPGELAPNLAKLDRLQQQRQSLALQIAEAETRLTMLSTSSGPVPAPTSPEERLESLRAQLEAQLGVLTENHPDVKKLRAQIAALESDVASSSGAAPSKTRLAASANRTVTELRAQLAETEALIADLDARVGLTPARQEQIASLEEKERVLRENYAAFLRKVQEAELAQSLEAAQQGERFTVLDRAVPPPRPKRSRLLYASSGVAAAFALAIGIGILLEMLDPVLATPEQLERLSGLPVLGSMPHMT